MSLSVDKLLAFFCLFPPLIHLEISGSSRLGSLGFEEEEEEELLPQLHFDVRIIHVRGLPAQKVEIFPFFRHSVIHDM